MEEEFYSSNATIGNESYVNPTPSPTIDVEPNTTVVDIAEVEIEHETDAITVLLMNVTIIGCLLLAYYVRTHRVYHLPERYVYGSLTRFLKKKRLNLFAFNSFFVFSAGALMMGMVIGGVARLSTDNLKLFEFVSRLLRSFGLIAGSSANFQLYCCYSHQKYFSFSCYHPLFLKPDTV